MVLQVEVPGKVTSGRGLATLDLSDAVSRVQELVKERLWPGSLNVVLTRPIRLRENAALVLLGEQRLFWPASLNGIDVWVYRWPAAPLHIVEIVSSVHLRERLQLKDGDVITLRLSGSHVRPIEALGWLVWNALWLGRRHWFYTRDAYYHAARNDLTMHVATKLGAAQQAPVTRSAARAWIGRTIGRRRNREAPPGF